MLTHGSLFSGVGGLDLGFDAAGIETLWQCEINAQCRSVLAKHWPDATRYTDVSDVKGNEVKPVDILTFGSPCQDLSVAGKRAGFQDGTRSNLYFEAIRIIEEMRHATDNQYPRFAVWENVRGALSSNGGNDFLAAIQALADIGAVDISWRVVNTCHFGPPQRRVRVFLVADFGGECAGEVLAQPARVCWHPPAIRGKGKETSTETEDSVAFDEYNYSLGDRIHHALRAGTKQSTGVLETFVKIIRSGARDTEGNLPAEVWRAEQVGPTLNVFDNGSESRATVIVPEDIAYRVRRLTPRECERLQGWTDDHTRWADTGKELSDSARYKMCGNGISAPVAQWLGENLVQALTND
jgi:DNA (cytosine-5)-methyltransferase 1